MLFAFNGRATRNFLALLVLMHFIFFVDRVDLATAAGVCRRISVSLTSRSTLPFQRSTTLTPPFSWSGAGSRTGSAFLILRHAKIDDLVLYRLVWLA
jgi:hypothetical protein